jgi:TATA-box binding protein (TBP) (component of TFIID and TFIIIB)
MIDFKKLTETEWHFEHNGYRGLIYKLNQTPVVFYYTIFKDSKRVQNGRERTLAEAQQKIINYVQS